MLISIEDMEIPVINRISDFAFISQVYGLSWIEKIYEDYSFWKWGALILALVASLSTISNRLEILISRFRRQHSLPSEPLVYDYDTDSDTDTDSSCSSSDDEREYDEEPSTFNRKNWLRVDEDFRVRGLGHLVDDQWENSNLFSWAEGLTSGKSVVKLWDNLRSGFGFDLDESDKVLNVYDVNKGTKLTSIFGGNGGFQAIAAPLSSPAVVISAGSDSSSRRVAVSAWDTRLRCRFPAIITEWRPKQPVEKIAAVNVDGVEKVYISSDVTRKLTVGDMRMVISPLRNLTESDVDIWWDADSGIVSESPLTSQCN